MTGTASRRSPQLVLFDLDGTLIDSAPDIAAAVNELLARGGRQQLTVAAVTSMVGNGVEKLVERAIAASGDALEGAALKRQQMAMIDIYAKHLTGLTVLMPGVREALDALHGDGMLLGLVTNKPQRFIETVLDHFGLSPLFGVVIGTYSSMFVSAPVIDFFGVKRDWSDAAAVAKADKGEYLSD